MHTQHDSVTRLLPIRIPGLSLLIWGLKALGFVLGVLSVAVEPLSSAETTSYPRRERLAEPNDLVTESPGSKRVILDVRDKEKYLASHVPGAVWVDVAEWSKAATHDDDAQNWTRRFTEVGIDTDSEVIVYDDQRLRSAARTWWILRLWGIANPKVLNGGWDTYLESKNPVQSGSAPRSKSGSFVAHLEDKVLATKEQLLKSHNEGKLGAAGPGSLQLIDTRSKSEFCGTDPARSKRVGTIPGSKHLEWSDLLEPNSSRLKSAEDLRQLFAQAGVDIHQPAVSFCQGGGRAAVTAFILDLMGSPESRNYYRSFGEWGVADDTPVVKGQ